MFLPGIFNEYMIENHNNDENVQTNDVGTKESKLKARNLMRGFSTVSITGPPPLETKKSVALLISEKSSEKKMSFWGKFKKYY